MVICYSQMANNTPKTRANWPFPVVNGKPLPPLPVKPYIVEDARW